MEFLVYGGCRNGDATSVSGNHCDFEKGEITVQGDPVTGTKNWEIRRIPMIPDVHRLLQRIKNERDDKDFQNSSLMRVQECQGTINTACKKLGIARFTHHESLPRLLQDAQQAKASHWLRGHAAPYRSAREDSRCVRKSISATQP